MNLGLVDLIASKQDEYATVADVLARDERRLGGLRLRLRDRMRTSPLMDAERFARDFENALRQMWRRWCEQPK